MPKRRRKHRSVAVEREIRKRQNNTCACGRCEKESLEGAKVQYNHKPPLALREFDEKADDYIPAENDPDYLFAEIAAHHRIGTHHPLGPHTTLNSDLHAINKVKHLKNPKRSKHRWPKGRKLQGRPFQKRLTHR